MLKLDNPIEHTDVSGAFRSTVGLLATLCKHQQALELVSNENELLDSVIEVIPHNNQDGPDDYIVSCCLILRYILRLEQTYVKVASRHPHMGDILGTRLARKGNSPEVMTECASAFRNFVRKPEFASKIDTVTVDYVVQAMRNSMPSNDEVDAGVRNTLGQALNFLSRVPLLGQRIDLLQARDLMRE